MRPLHTSLNTIHSECKPSSSISSFTHSLQVFLPLPTHLTPATTTFLQADTQSSPLLRSTCPNHLNLPRFTTSATLWIPKDCTNPHCASYPSATPHTSMHCQIICRSFQLFLLLEELSNIIYSCLLTLTVVQNLVWPNQLNVSHFVIQRQLLPSHSSEIPCLPSKGIPSERLRLVKVIHFT